MIPVNRTFAPIQALVDELARCGMEHAVTCPGSRNAPLVLTLAAESRIRSHSVIDERSAGFVALGIAKATRKPVAITCTSGSAAANLLPAIVEAHESRVPLIVLTADRPPELRGVGAGQAIDQLKLYGSAAKWFVEVGTHEPTRGTAIHFRALACRAWATALRGRPGVVHLNFPLREPLAPVPEELDAAEWDGRPGGRPWVVVTEQEALRPDDSSVDVVADLRDSPRGAIVCGPSREDLVPGAVALAAVTGWPILADALSGLRCGGHDRSHVIAHYDVVLRDERFAADHSPDLVVRLGDTPTSKALRAWLAGAPQLVVDPDAAWHEPTRTAETIVRERAEWAVAVAARLVAELPEGEPVARPPWLESWLAADALVPGALDDAPDPFEPKVYAALADALPDGAAVWVASSMPVREVEAFFPPAERRIRFLANRGANGIDGTVSSAAGAAVARGDGRTYVLTGDLALLHDVGGLITARRLGAELTIVCVNNGGGAIFDFLPVAQAADPVLYEEHIATPAGIDLARVAGLVEMRHTVASTPDEVRAAVAEPGLVEVRTDRAANVALHREVYAKVAEQLSA